MKKGFTLVELLSALVLLSLIALITVTTVSSQYKNSKTKLENKQIKLIKLSASMYVADNKLEISKKNIDCFSLDVSFLINEGYIDEDIKDLNTKQLLKDSEYYINVTKQAKTYKYEFSDNITDKCQTLDFSEEIIP